MAVEKKSSRHSKITGDFAEALVLYWLSRDGFECMRVDHTGIDLLARNRHTDELMGISVKSRSRYTGTEYGAVSIKSADLDKAAAACKTFACSPYFAIVVDGGERLWLFLTSLEHMKQVVKLGVGKVHWGMTKDHIEHYLGASAIKCVEFTAATRCWWANAEVKDSQGVSAIHASVSATTSRSPTASA